MKILVVHQYYLLPGEPGGSRFNEFARLWSAQGHEVTVIAGTVNYATGEVSRQYRGRWVTREKEEGVSVWRCHVPDSYSKSYVGRAWAFSGFTFSASTAALKVGRPDVVIATSPPLVTAVPAWLIARRHRVPFVFEIRDLWPESAVTTGVLDERSSLTRALYRLERWACRSAACINVLTPAFRDDLLRRGLATADKIAFVPNGADTEVFRPGPRENSIRKELGWGDRFVAMYAGAHGRANALRQLLDAAERLQDRPDILIACVGDGPERGKLEDEAHARGLSKNIVFLGAQPKARMPEFIQACDAGLAVLQNNPTFTTVYPNKVFDYMSCARATILAIDGVARRLVCEEAKAGVFVEPENGEALAQAICQLAGNAPTRAEMGKRGREWVLANATREALASRYLSVLKELTSKC